MAEELPWIGRTGIERKNKGLDNFWKEERRNRGFVFAGKKTRTRVGRKEGTAMVAVPGRFEEHKLFCELRK